MNTNKNYNEVTMREISRAKIECRVVSDAEAHSGVGRRVGVCPSCGGAVIHRQWVKISGCVGLSDSKRESRFWTPLYNPLAMAICTKFS